MADRSLSATDGCDWSTEVGDVRPCQSMQRPVCQQTQLELDAVPRTWSSRPRPRPRTFIFPRGYIKAKVKDLWVQDWRSAEHDEHLDRRRCRIVRDTTGHINLVYQYNFSTSHNRAGVPVDNCLAGGDIPFVFPQHLYSLHRRKLESLDYRLVKTASWAFIC